MWNDLLNIINNSKTPAEVRNKANILFKQLNTAAGSVLLKNEIATFLQANTHLTSTLDHFSHFQPGGIKLYEDDGKHTYISSVAYGTVEDAERVIKNSNPDHEYWLAQEIIPVYK